MSLAARRIITTTAATVRRVFMWFSRKGRDLDRAMMLVSFRYQNRDLVGAGTSQ
jgi:hypothetical protein